MELFVFKHIISKNNIKEQYRNARDIVILWSSELLCIMMIIIPSFPCGLQWSEDSGSYHEGKGNARRIPDEAAEDCVGMGRNP